MAKEPTPSTIDERLTWNEGDLELFDADGNPIDQDVIDEKDAPKPAVEEQQQDDRSSGCAC